MKQGRTIIEAGLSPDASPLPPDEEGESEPASELRQLVVDEERHGRRLDQALAELVPEFSRNYLQQLVNGGAVALNGRRAARPAHRVKAGDAIAIELRPTPQSLAFRPEPMPLSVVHEDEHLLVIDKPPGLVVHPAPGNWTGTLLNGLLARDERAGLLPRAGIVHRLDKDTSGLMVVARTRAAMDALVRAIAARAVARQYIAIAHRRWSGPPTRVVDAPIGRDPRNRLRMAVVGAADPGKAAMTTFELLDTAQEACLVRASLHTGRTHQIRVHMAHLGHPLVGDALYGGSVDGGLGRQALHAFRLAFAHPFTGEALDFASALPADLVHGLSLWGLRYNPAPAMAPHATPAGPAAQPAQGPRR
ncbi:RluA family pseudouridine synthase [Ramlibacter henchirensis]|uniref:RluA family pseudouridine synthase n=1 Tax=Ramlibacter henchirensis TaxID=204072 RepID=UPI003B845124